MTEQQQLEAAIAALERQRSRLGDAVVEPLLSAARAKLAALTVVAAPSSVPAQNLRQVSILFLDVVGSTALAQHLDPEAVSAVMDDALSRGTEIVQAHGGKVLQYAGDNILAVFGADEAREDDAARAVQCGLDLLKLGGDLGAEVWAAHCHDNFNVRVGVHTGSVLLGGGVDDDSIRGQAVNIAARMEQTAPAGALRISHDTYRLVRGLFDVDAQALRVKGVDEPLQSYLVLGAKLRSFRIAGRGIEGVETRMIGREADLEALRSAFERLLQPSAGLQRVLVIADAGVGKSRLLYEFQDWAQGQAKRFHLFQARATPQTQEQPYGLMRELFAGRCQILDSDSMNVAKRKLEDELMPLFAADEEEHEAEGHVHLLGQLIGLDYGHSRHIRSTRDDARQIRQRGFHAGALAFRRIIEQGSGFPAVIELDDLHWADDGSLDFIDHLARVALDLPVLMLALTRPTLFERQTGAARTISGAVEQRIELRPLDESDSWLLADELLRKVAEGSPALRKLVIRGAAGNPFYMEELVKMFIDQGAIATAPERWTINTDKLLALKVPSTLIGVLQTRLDGLPPRERRALQLASVVGLRFWDVALAHVEAPAAAELPALRARNLVDASDAADGNADGMREYAFCHQILHQVTYDTVLKRVKRQAHARAADWLAHHSGALSTSLLGAAAQHYEGAGDTANAAAFYLRAAEHQAGIFSHDAALDYTARALKLAPHDAVDLRWRLLANRERVLDMLGRREPQLADIEAMQALAEVMPNCVDGDTRRAEVAWRRADIADRTGDYPAAEREARRAQALAEQAGDEALALRALKRLVQALAYQGDPAAGKVLAEAGLVRARALGLAAQESGLLNALTVCTDSLGDRVAGLHSSLLDLALNREAGNRINEAVAQSCVGMSYLTFGVFEEARLHLQQALRLLRTLGNRSIEGNTHSVLSELAWREGDGTLALSEAQIALDIAIEVGSRLHQCDSLWSLGNAELALAHWDAAERVFKRSEAVAREIARAPQVLNAIDGQARVALARGDTVRAQSLAEHLIDEAGLGDSEDAAANSFAGTYEHLIRLTLHLVWAGAGDAPRAAGWLARAHAILEAEADRIHNTDLRRTFLSRIAEHRAIGNLWKGRA